MDWYDYIELLTGTIWRKHDEEYGPTCNWTQGECGVEFACEEAWEFGEGGLNCMVRGLL